MLTQPLTETLSRAQAILDEFQEHDSQRVRRHLSESERRLPEWIRERQRRLDEAYALKQHEADEWLAPALAAGAIALGGAGCSGSNDNNTPDKQATAQTDTAQTDTTTAKYQPPEPDLRDKVRGWVGDKWQGFMQDWQKGARRPKK